MARLVDKKAYKLAHERDGSRCQFPTMQTGRWPDFEGPRCGVYPAQAHHRLARGQLGPDHISNLVCVCERHHRWVEGNPRQATALGLSLYRKYADEEQIEEIERLYALNPKRGRL